MFGYGTYQGKEIPPKGTIGAFGIDLGEVGIRNPKILLDDGNVVWGCQCWWGPENKIKALEDILNLSNNQGYTCMYSKEELETFPQERLDVIYAGIAALGKSEDEKEAI